MAAPEKKSARVADTGGSRGGVSAGQQDNTTDKPTRYASQARWRAQNPKAVWAHVALKSALRRGLIEKQPCEVCGDPNSEGHHESYDRPADVTWLCRRHHKQRHAEIRKVTP